MVADKRQRICVVGPLPPPSGGMANQCEQLVRLLSQEGVAVELVRTNSPYSPPWVGAVPLLRAACRLIPYALALWSAAGRAQVMHVFANSGWSWYLFASPALLVGRIRGAAVIVNYRGGHAESFLAGAPAHVHRSLKRSTLRVTPSPFLQRVFAKFGLQAEVIPNIIDLSRFKLVTLRDFGNSPHIVVARNLEPIYGIATALKAFALVRRRFVDARLSVAGSGPELASLQALAKALGIAEAVRFSGRIDNAAMPQFYADADCALNPSTVDNMPISLLEAFASGLPVVSTNAGGIPDMLQDGVSGLLVPVGDEMAMAGALCRLLDDPALAAVMVEAGREQAKAYDWQRVKLLWLDAYQRAAAQSGAT